MYVARHHISDTCLVKVFPFFHNIHILPSSFIRKTEIDPLYAYLNQIRILTLQLLIYARLRTDYSKRFKKARKKTWCLPRYKICQWHTQTKHIRIRPKVRITFCANPMSKNLKKKLAYNVLNAHARQSALSQRKNKMQLNFFCMRSALLWAPKFAKVANKINWQKHMNTNTHLCVINTVMNNKISFLLQ